VEEVLTKRLWRPGLWRKGRTTATGDGRLGLSRGQVMPGVSELLVTGDRCGEVL
jgi:hypothetical protein